MDIKLSDDEIVKALECCINECDCENCPYGNNDDCMANVEHILDLINRQKEEIERLTEKTKSQLVLNQTIQTLNEKILAENAELQKQVDELKSNQVIECYGILKGCDIVKQAVKDTAKEILKEIRGYYPIDLAHCDKGEAFILELCYELAERYGVEVE